MLYSSLSKFKLYPFLLVGKSVSTDYTLTDEDYAVGVNSSGGEVVITIPDISTLRQTPREWAIKKMTDDTNRVIVNLENVNDGMYGPDFHALKLLYQGAGILVIANANGKYTFAEWSGIESEYLSLPVVSTQTPNESDGTLTMYGNVDDIGAEVSVYAFFRYRDMTTGGSWVETTKQTVNTVGAYTDTASVTAGDIFDVQAIVEDISTGTRYFGAVLDTSVNYYNSTAEAANDGLLRYWPLNETSGVDTDGDEVMASDTMSFYNGVTINSVIINGNTIYERVFGSQDYGENGYSAQFSHDSMTIMLQISNSNTSGDHTMLNFGRNILSLASDTSSIQLEVNGHITTWSGSQPLAMSNLFIVIDAPANHVILYTATASSVTQRAVRNEVPNNNGVYIRVGRGTAGDANHQDNEYLDNGTVRSLALWKRVLSASEMQDICTVLDTDGELLVI